MSPYSKNIGAVILAAGGSSRFGQLKQLVPFRGKTLLRRIVDAASAAGCSPVVVVTGSNEEKIDDELQQSDVIKIQNTNWQRGIGSSIRTGVQVVIDRVPSVEAIILLVCDQPLVEADTIQRVITLRKNTNRRIVASSYAGTLGVPALFGRSFFCELLSIDDEAGAKSVILRNGDCVAQLEVPEGEIDVDTWEDWEKLNGTGHPERSEGSLTS
ncbi:MAG: nucleotidyltransferase family protein [Candidatus Udaeobacter sp.]